MVRGYVVTFSFLTFRILIEMPIWSFAGQSRLAVVLWLSWVAPRRRPRLCCGPADHRSLLAPTCVRIDDGGPTVRPAMGRPSAAVNSSDEAVYPRRASQGVISGGH